MSLEAFPTQFLMASAFVAFFLHLEPVKFSLFLRSGFSVILFSNCTFSLDPLCPSLLVPDSHTIGPSLFERRNLCLYLRIHPSHGGFPGIAYFT